MQKYFFIPIFLLLSITIYANENFSSEHGMANVNMEDYYKGMYWGTYGLHGFTAIMNTIGQTINACAISQDMKTLADDIYNANIDDMFLLDSFSDNYPAMMFGANFLLSGLAFLPAYGGIVYGSAMLTTAVAFTIVRSVDPRNFFWNSEFPDDETSSSLFGEVYDLHRRAFDPSSYFAVGIFSILSGVAEVIINYLYRREIKRRKYPYIQKSFTFNPNYISIKFDWI